jgi:SAM-dependent methyltransferase
MTTTSDTATQQDIPWQIKMFRRSLKKQLKLDALLEFAGDLSGALNWYFRAQGGVWTWADVDGDNLEQISQLLGEPVLLLPEDQFPFEKECYDCVISIDVLEHLEDDQPFLLEINRVLKPGGTAIVTVPNGDAMLLANRIKWRVGMIPEVYGHTRAGGTRKVDISSGFDPYWRGGILSLFHRDG